MTTAEQQVRQTRFRRLVAAGAWLRARKVQIAVFILLLLFVGLTVIARSPSLRTWDSGITHMIQRGENPALTGIAEGLTNFGTFWGYLVVSIVAGGWLWRIKKPIGAQFLIGSNFGHVINIAIKAITHRPRPNADDAVQVIMHASGTSFPSGHAQAAVMFLGFLMVLISIHVRARPVRYTLNALCVCLIVGVCLSRIYLGAHFLSDVIGGIMCGLIFLWLWVVAYKRWGAKEFAPAPKERAVER